MQTGPPAALSLQPDCEGPQGHRTGKGEGRFGALPAWPGQGRGEPQGVRREEGTGPSWGGERLEVSGQRLLTLGSARGFTELSSPRSLGDDRLGEDTLGPTQRVSGPGPEVLRSLPGLRGNPRLGLCLQTSACLLGEGGRKRRDAPESKVPSSCRPGQALKAGRLGEAAHLKEPRRPQGSRLTGPVFTTAEKAQRLLAGARNPSGRGRPGQLPLRPPSPPHS